MVQLFIEGIAMPVSREWQEVFDSCGFRRPSMFTCGNQLRQDDPLHPKPLSGLPTYVMWGLTDDEIGALEGEDGYEEAAARRSAAMQGLRDEITRLQDENSTLVQQLSYQDTRIAHMMARLERMEMLGTYPGSFICCSHLTLYSTRNLLERWIPISIRISYPVCSRRRLGA